MLDAPVASVTLADAHVAAVAGLRHSRLNSWWVATSRRVAGSATVEAAASVRDSEYTPQGANRDPKHGSKVMAPGSCEGQPGRVPQGSPPRSTPPLFFPEARPSRASSLLDPGQPGRITCRALHSLGPGGSPDLQQPAVPPSPMSSPVSLCGVGSGGQGSGAGQRGGAFFQQAGETATRRAHNPEIPGATPGPATIFSPILAILGRQPTAAGRGQPAVPSNTGMP